MAENEKVELYNALKNDLGWQPDKHFREYNVDELKALAVQLQMQKAGDHLSTGAEPDEPIPPAARPAFAAPVAPRNPNEMAGERQNANSELKPIRTDPESGRLILQEEVQKPASPKPRGRRILKYMESDVVEQTIKSGDYVETFEVEGKGQKRPAEARITLPSYQVGIAVDPRFKMFKIHFYGGREGFDFDDVNNYYGGAEMVPSDIKRMYVSNVLCYDMRTVIRAIQTEFRALQLQGKV